MRYLVLILLGLLGLACAQTVNVNPWAVNNVNYCNYDYYGRQTCRVTLGDNTRATIIRDVRTPGY